MTGAGVDIGAQVIAIIARQARVEPAAIRLEVSLADLGLDSLGLVETIFAIEETLDITIPFNANEPDASPFDSSTVAAVIAAVEALVAAKRA